ncbi:hypothetical protein D3Z36_02725 [Lachnospiraceae bacterium]|nr:hypothetical protein [Lachnospiraceae bacterium]
MRKNVKTIISAIAFCVIFASVFQYITNVYRPSSGYDRTHIIAFDEQQDLDVVYIGGSACFVFWQPLRAWNEWGIASYNYATNGLEGANIEYMIRHSESAMHPDLYIVGVRPYQLWSESGNTGTLRYVTDSWSLLSPARYQLINSFFKKHNSTEKVDYPSYIFNIINYHDNGDVLKNPANWHYKEAHEKAPNKGWEWVEAYQYLQAPKGWNTTERTALINGAEAALRELCEYCSSENLNVLFVVCPYYIEQEHQKMYNTIDDIVSEYGFDFLNTNEYYDEIGIDFNTDFYNRRHVNCFGAEKYTKFLGQYITEHYNLRDHRGEKGYESWGEDYRRFCSEEESYKQSIKKIMENDLQGFELAEKLKKDKDISSWYLNTKSNRYTLLIYNNGVSFENDADLEMVCSKWGITANSYGCNIVSDEVIKEANVISEELLMEGVIGKDSPANGVAYSISNEHLMIDGMDYYENVEGLIIVAVDNNLQMIADRIIVDTSSDNYVIKR